MKGIMNIGNSCYLNAALQLLFNSDNFGKLLNNNQELDSNMKIYHSSENKVFKPHNIKSIVDKRTRQFRGATQQDSSEFIIYLFDIISNSNKDMLDDLFGIQTNISIKCKLIKCLQESSHIETNLLLYLPLTKDLSESYRIYKTNERLENDNAYYCNNCKEKTIARKKTETVKWPLSLIIVLRRFDARMRKDERDILVPIDWRHGYVLRGGIIHSGSYGGGHYYYYGYNKQTSQWFIANDSNINIINDVKQFFEKTVVQSYIVYYEKLE